MDVLLNTLAIRLVTDADDISIAVRRMIGGSEVALLVKQRCRARADMLSGYLPDVAGRALLPEGFNGRGASTMAFALGYVGAIMTLIELSVVPFSHTIIPTMWHLHIDENGISRFTLQVVQAVIVSLITIPLTTVKFRMHSASHRTSHS